MERAACEEAEERVARADLRIRSLKGERGLRFNRAFLQGYPIKLDPANYSVYCPSLLPVDIDCDEGEEVNAGNYHSGVQRC